MNEIFLVYLITVAVSLETAALTILVMGSIVYCAIFVVVAGIKAVENEEKTPLYDWLVLTYKKFITAFIVLTSLVVLIPDKKDFYFIIGGSVALSLSQNEEAQKLPNNVLKALNAFLEETVEAEEE